MMPRVVTRFPQSKLSYDAPSRHGVGWVFSGDNDRGVVVVTAHGCPSMGPAVGLLGGWFDL